MARSAAGRSAGRRKSQEVQEAIKQYSAELAAIKTRLNEDIYSFFADADLHDGELLELRVIDGSRPAALSAPAHEWQTVIGYPVKAELAVLDAMDEFVWRVSYSALRRIVVEFPGNEALFYHPREGFGDWRYHELTDLGNGVWRHEILFASGSILMFDFQEITVSKAAARDFSARPADS